MTTAVAPQVFTPEDLLTMHDSKSFELKRGQLLARHMSVLSSSVGAELLTRLGAHCPQHAPGLVWAADNGYQCFPHDPTLVRKANVSFIRNDRLSPDLLSQGWSKISPDLVAEIISPNDLATEIEQKL